jgi:protocatechuate 4,5-dioxygenase alpha chain
MDEDVIATHIGSPMESRKGDWGLPGTYVFDLEKSRQGYALNKLCMSLSKPENRDAYVADEEGYLTKYALSDEQKDAVRRRDWLRMIQLGGNLFFLLKLAATVGHGLYQVCAQERGETLEQFLATRKVPGAR